MKILVAVLTFIALPLFAQQPPPKPAPTTTQAMPPRPGPPPTFTQLEQVIANDIATKSAALQQETDDFMIEVREHHPGYYFSNGNLVPVQQQQKPEEPKK